MTTDYYIEPIPKTRQEFPAYDNLITSLKTHGYTGDPIIIRETAAGSEIIDGELRNRACQALGITPPVRVVDWDDERSRQEKWTRNWVRRHLTKRDIITATLKVYPATSTADIARFAGVSATYVGKIRRQYVGKIRRQLGYPHPANACDKSATLPTYGRE